VCLNNPWLGSSIYLHKLTTSLQSRIELLNVSLSALRNNGIAKFCQSLKKNETVTHLSLYGNYLEASGFMTVIEAIKNHPSLQLLDMGSNNIFGQDISTEASNQLLLNKSLHTLLLDENPLGRHKSYQFDLQGQPRNPNSLDTLSLGLPKNLTCLSLSQCDLGYSNFAPILSKLEKESNLCHLNVSRNNFDDTAINRIVNRILANKDKLSLKTFCFHLNHLVSNKTWTHNKNRLEQVGIDSGEALPLFSTWRS